MSMSMPYGDTATLAWVIERGRAVVTSLNTAMQDADSTPLVAFLEALAIDVECSSGLLQDDQPVNYFREVLGLTYTSRHVRYEEALGVEELCRAMASLEGTRNADVMAALLTAFEIERQGRRRLEETVVKLRARKITSSLPPV